MSSSPTECTLSKLARRVVDLSAAPAAVVAAAWRQHDSWKRSLGSAGIRSMQASQPVSTGAVFDLASLTKPIVAVTIAREAAHLGRSLSENLGDLLPTLEHTSVERAPLELALAHRAGLRAHLELFADWRRGSSFHRETLIRAAARRRPDLPPSHRSEVFPPHYSDLGYLIAGLAIERCTGTHLDELVAKHISKPLRISLGSMRWWLQQRGFSISSVVPTEHVGWRRGEILGQVHDENAWMLAGHRTAGHAGLFGTAQAVCEFATSVLDALAGRGDSWLDATHLRPLIMQRTGGSLRAGFDGKSEQNSSAGALCSNKTFGHLGFTGTSFWCDPEHDIVTVVLTNRVSPARSNQRLRSLRPALHDALYDFARSQ